MAQAKRDSITRRAMIAGSAAALLPDIAASSADPIFAAIGAHWRAYSDILILLDAQRAADEALHGANDLARPALQLRLDQLCRAEGPLGKIEMRATDRLIATVPSTLDGAVAVLRYLRVLFERDEYSPIEDQGYRSLLWSIERGIGGR
jgi:hypothetical protein